jgi:glycosyltransferase involved in cell wall biosynthesis
MIAPARLPLYSALADRFDLLVLHGGMEANRSWQGVEKALPNATITRAWGWQIPTMRNRGGGFLDRRYVHITPGFITHLFRFRPDVIVSNEMGFRTLVALAYGTLLRKPVWVWWGGTLHTERETGAARKAFRALISRWARHWISYGKTSTEYLLSLGIDRETILEIQNAVDERQFARRLAQDDAPAFSHRPRPVLLCVGSLIARKGIEQLLHAAAALQREGREFSLLLVGNGPDGPMLKQLAQDLSLKNVHFHPEHRPQEMPSVYHSGDIFVFPTLEDVWGLVANEAVLSGLPVLCSRHAGCAAELFERRNIFDPQNPREFRDKLRAALDGELAGPDSSRLRTTGELGGDLIRALEGCLRHAAGSRPEGRAADIVEKRAQ